MRNDVDCLFEKGRCFSGERETRPSKIPRGGNDHSRRRSAKRNAYRLENESIRRAGTATMFLGTIAPKTKDPRAFARREALAT